MTGANETSDRRSKQLVQAIALLESSSIAAGIRAADEMVKAAPVMLLESRPVCPGKYLVLVGGEVAEVESSRAKGRMALNRFLVDELFIPNLHPQVFPALTATSEVADVEALGIIETFTAATGIVAGDEAAKAANVLLIDIRLAMGLGGKSFVTLCGEVASVEAAVAAGTEPVRREGLLVHSEILPSPRRDLFQFLL